MTNTETRVSDILLKVFMGVLALYFVAQIIYSLDWPMLHDTPVLHYIAFLIAEHDFVPYRDIFEISLPFTYLIHLGIVKAFGYGDVPLRIIDIVSHLGLLTVTWLFLRRLDQRVAWIAALLFGLFYFNKGPEMSFQRDGIALLPLMASLLLAARARQPKATALLIGALLALSASIKPHFAIGYPVVFFYMLCEFRDSSSAGPESLRYWVIKTAPWFLLGFGVCMLLPFLWLWSVGGLGYFLKFYSTYMPLYLQLSNAHLLITGMDRWFYLVKGYILGVRLLILPIGFGLFAAFLNTGLTRKQHRLIVTLGLLTLCYSIYPAISGQFWPYHWTPFRFFAFLCIALLAMPSAGLPKIPLGRSFTSLFLVFFVTASVVPSQFFLDAVKGRSFINQELSNANQITAFFSQAQLQPDESVQPIDWGTTGSLKGMLAARARIATPFLADAQFYHHISSPYTQKLRRQFMALLNANPPTFFISITKRPIPTGPDTTTQFRAFEKFLRDNYALAYQTPELSILQYKER